MMINKQYLVVLLICSNVIGNLLIQAQLISGARFCCDFEADCGMRHSVGVDDDWAIEHGFVVYKADGDASAGDTAGLETPVLTDVKTPGCVNLKAYLQYIDSDIPGQLQVWLGPDLNNTRDLILEIDAQVKQWHSISLDVMIDPHERLILKAIRGSIFIQIEVDLITIYLTTCNATGVWGEWGEWSNCSGTCGSGTRDRSRMCDDCYEPCTGNGTQTDTCTPSDCTEPDPIITVEPECCCEVQGDPHIIGFDKMSVFVDVAENDNCRMVSTLGRTRNPSVCTYEVNTKFGANLTPTGLIIKISPVNNSAEYTYRMPPTNDDDDSSRSTSSESQESSTNRLYVPITHIGNTWTLSVNDSTCQLQISLIMNEEAKICVRTPDDNLERARQGLCGNCNGQFDDYYLSNGTSVMNVANKFELMKDSFCQGE